MPTEGIVTPLATLFAEIEQAQMPEAIRTGTMQRRIPSDSMCDLFIGVQKPANVRLLIARFDADVLPDGYDLPAFKSLDIQVRRETEGTTERLTATVRAPQAAWNDIFTSLAEDIARAVGSQTSESEAARIFRSRLLQWQLLLQKTGTAGLTEEQQQGLYGELWCLREIVLPALPSHSAVMAWTGPGGTDRDFQFVGAIALEVKTTRSSGTPALSISSERQLDDTGLQALYLLHLPLEKMQGAGETLPQIVAVLRSLLRPNPLTMAIFEDRLLNAGYLETQSALYQQTGYTTHGINLYRVQESFPRIIPQELLPGVGGVRYTISTAACQPFAADIHAFRTQLGASE